MPLNTKTTRALPVPLPIEGYAALKQLADEERRSMADIARIALEDYLQRRGRTVSLKIERGGDRTPKPDGSPA